MLPPMRWPTPARRCRCRPSSPPTSAACSRRWPTTSCRPTTLPAAPAAGGTSGSLDGALDADTVAAIFERLGGEAKQTLIELVSQGAFAAPEYGGNRDGAGWALCNYEGDSQPLGYSLYDEKAGRY